MRQIDVGYLPIWKRYLELFRDGRLSDQELGALLRVMMEYHFEGAAPQGLSDTLRIYWLFLQKDLDHARQQYETSVNNGKKGGRRKKEEPNITQQNLEEGKTITESKSESESRSITETEKEHSASSTSGEEALCVSKKAYGEYGWVLLSDQEYERLKETMGAGELKRCIAYIDESAQSTGNRNHWLDWCTVLRRCHQKGWHESAQRYSRKEEIPKGASGELGPIELDAIHQLLKEG